MRVVAGLVVAVVVSSGAAAWGASFVVDSGVWDAPDANPADGVCATASGGCSLLAAIEQANAIAGEPHEITVPAGFYGPDGGYPSIVQDVTIRGAGDDVTLIGTGHPTYARLFDVAPGGRLALHDVSLTGARVGPGSVVRARGGAVTLDGCFVFYTSGGAIDAAAESPLENPVTIRVIGTRFLDNTGGPAIAVGTSYGLVLEDGTFEGTLPAPDQPGGAILISGGGAGRSHSIARSIFEANVASGGGAVAVTTDAGPLTVTLSRFERNLASGSGGPLGGGAILSLESSLVVTDTSFIDNASAEGGAIRSHGTLSCTGCTFTGNTAVTGGAVHATAATLVNSTVFRNGASTSGGGIYVPDPAVPAALRLANVTVVYNTANESGGGIRAGSTNVVVKNSLIAANWAPTAKDCAGTMASQGYNLLADPTGCDLSPTTGDQIGAIAREDLFGDHGGPTHTLRLFPQSPAVDGGDPAGCTDFVPAPLTTDQRGAPRPSDGDGDGTAVCDIGAFEMPMLPPPVCAGGTPVDRAALAVKRVLEPSGDEALVFRGVISSAGAPAEFEPATTGAQLLIEDLGNGDTAMFELSHRTTPIPGGAGCLPQDGWKRLRYRNASGTIDPPACTAGSAKGLRSLRFKDRRATGKGIGFAAAVKRSNLAMPVGPFRGTIVLGGSVSSSLAGECGVRTFAAGDCLTRGATIRCR
jgi:predicted outer membrane repeat protein